MAGPGKQVQACTLIVLTGLLVYANHLACPFQFDSVQFIPDNPVMRNPEKVATLEYAFRNFFSRGGLFYTFGWNAILGGFDPLGYHLVNLALHLMNGLLVMFITVKACRALRWQPPAGTSWTTHRVALVTALLFVCHPLQTESVVYIVSRSELLAGTFYLAAFYLFQIALERHAAAQSAWPAAAGVVLCALVGFSAKQTLASLPAVLLLYFLLCAPAGSGLTGWFKRWRFVLAGLTAAALLMLFHKLLTDEAFLIGPSAAGEVIGRKNYMLTQPSVILFYYFRLFLLPLSLNVDPDIPLVRSPAAPEFWVSAGLILLALAAAFRLRSGKIYFFLVCWVLIVLSPSSSIITLLDLAAEHRAYLAVYGFSFLLVLALAALSARLAAGPGRVAMALVPIALVTALSALTLERNRVWSSELSLWHDAEAKSPGKVRPLINLGRAYTLKGDFVRARHYYEKSLVLEDGYFQSHYNLAVLLLKLGEEDRALTHFQRAAVLDPTVADTHGRLGEIFLKRKQFDLADRHLKRAVELNPQYAEAFRNLGALHYYELGRRREGRAYLERSLKLNPAQQGADLIRALLATPETGN